MTQPHPSTPPDSNPFAPSGCTLSDRGFAERLQWIQKAILPHAVYHRRIHEGHVIQLCDSSELVAALDQLIELEAACCSGLEIEHHVDSSTQERVLTLRGAQTAQIDKVLVTAFRDPPATDENEPQASRLTRILRSAGIGSAVAAALCCGLPALIGIVLGAQVAVSFAGWDTPLAVAFVAVSVGCFVFFGGLRAFYQALRKPGSSDCSRC